MPMWDDEEPNWEVEEPTPPPAPTDAPATDAGEAKGGEAAAQQEAGEAPPEDPDSIEGKKFNRHWVRPKFLQYSYMYDYRKNYYDDVIDYLDRRSRGLAREPPRPQTWAERVLRTYSQKLHPTETAKKVRERGWVTELELRLLTARYFKAKTNDQIVTRLHTTRALLDEHTKNYYHRAFTIAY